jgi:hypothetical protein
MQIIFFKSLIWCTISKLASSDAPPSATAVVEPLLLSLRSSENCSRIKLLFHKISKSCEMLPAINPVQLTKMFECSQNTNKCVNKKDIFFQKKRKMMNAHMQQQMLEQQLMQGKFN